MTPGEFKEWVRTLQDLLPARDSRWWSYPFRIGAALLAIAYVQPAALPHGWAESIIHWAGLGTIVAAKMGWSGASSPEPRTVFLPPPQPMPPNVAMVPADAVLKDGDR